MSGIMFENVYDFSTNLTAGWQATFHLRDGEQAPFDLDGCDASISLYRQDTDQLEFNWTTDNNLLTLGDSQVIANVAPSQMTPSSWVLAAERYPVQYYRYVLEINRADNTLLIGISGNFTIYDF